MPFPFCCTLASVQREKAKCHETLRAKVPATRTSRFGRSPFHLLNPRSFAENNAERPALGGKTISPSAEGGVNGIIEEESGISNNPTVITAIHAEGTKTNSLLHDSTVDNAYLDITTELPASTPQSVPASSELVYRDPNAREETSERPTIPILLRYEYQQTPESEEELTVRLNVRAEQTPDPAANPASQPSLVALTDPLSPYDSDTSEQSDHSFGGEDMEHMMADAPFISNRDPLWYLDSKQLPAASEYTSGTEFNPARDIPTNGTSPTIPPIPIRCSDCRRLVPYSMFICNTWNLELRPYAHVRYCRTRHNDDMVVRNRELNTTVFNCCGKFASTASRMAWREFPVCKPVGQHRTIYLTHGHANNRSEGSGGGNNGDDYGNDSDREDADRSPSK